MPGALPVAQGFEDGLMHRMYIHRYCARVYQPWAAL